MYFFHETFGLGGLISSWVWRKATFFNSESFALRQLAKVFRSLPLKARTISDGNLEKSPGIKKAAYEHALRKAEDLLQDFDCLSKRSLLGIDVELITRKFLVEVLSKKYHFYGLAGQYVAEHSNAVGILYVDSLLPEEELPSVPCVRVIALPRFPRVQYIISLFAMPIYCVLFYWKNRSSSETHFSDSVICQVDGKKSHNMFLALFGGRPNLRFVIERQYLVAGHHYENFEMAEVNRLGLVIKSLGSRDYAKLKELTKQFMSVAIRNFSRLSKYGSLLFELYGAIAHGILQSVTARRSIYIAYEHLFLPNAVRNELLRVDGNVSVSLPYGTQIESHFFASGYQYNYDILCSTGKLQERVYSLQHARTKTILPVGPYETHKEILEDDDYFRRIRLLRKFKGTDTSITILSSGIQDETYSGEVKLMQLARRLAAEPRVRVFIRPKPMPPPAKYRDFFARAYSNSDSIMLTDAEYQLTDFLPVTDLFITFTSHSAADICAAGGRIFCVNFLDDEAFALWQNTVTGVYLKSETAFDSIMSWVRDSPSGERIAHDRRMAELSSLISYNYKTFDLYKNNLLARLGPFLPKTGA